MTFEPVLLQYVDTPIVCSVSTIANFELRPHGSWAVPKISEVTSGQVNLLLWLWTHHYLCLPLEKKHTNQLPSTSDSVSLGQWCAEMLFSASVVSAAVLASLPRRKRPRIYVAAYQQKHLHVVSCLEKHFISTGYSNWKDAVSKFTKHDSSRCHQESVLKTVTLPSTTGNVGEMLCSQIATQWSERRQCFLKVLSNVWLLARQGLALRGDSDEPDFNFMSLLNLRSEDDSKFVEWVKQKTCKYTLVAMQNEMVRVKGLPVLHRISTVIFKMLLFTQ